jgi:transmembrane sensor
VRAYLEVALIWNEGASLDPERSYDTETLIAQARQPSSHVIALTAARSAVVAQTPEERHVPRRSRLVALAAGMALAAVGLTTLVWMKQNPVYASMVGEQRSIVLADGSEVTLNSKTKVRMRLTDEQRRIELLEGQALFRVAKDPQRPFIVHSGDTAVRAVGTVFDVYRKSSETVVTVTEGRVSVSGGGAEAPAGAGSAQQPSSQSHLTSLPLYVSAGQQLIVTAAGSQQTTPNVAEVTAWTSRKMIFKDARLADVAAEFNRYNVKQLAIDDADLKDLRISAIFSSTNAASLLNYLRTQPGIVVRERGSQIVIEKVGSPVSTP